jgi:hypothetical protein
MKILKNISLLLIAIKAGIISPMLIRFPSSLYNCEVDGPQKKDQWLVRLKEHRTFIKGQLFMVYLNILELFYIIYR